MAAKNGARQTAIDADNKDERKGVLLQPSLLTWDLFVSSALAIAIVFVCMIAAIIVMRSFLMLIKEKPNPFLWLFIFSFVVVPQILPWYGMLYPFFGIPIFVLILIVRAFKRGRERELGILFCCAAAASIGLGAYFTYNTKYQDARLFNALGGNPFPEDVTPIPPFDPSLGIAYHGADALPEFEIVDNSRLPVRIPVEKGFSLKNKWNKEDSVSFVLFKPDPQNSRGAVDLEAQVSVSDKPAGDPSMQEYIKEKYASLDTLNIILNRHRLFDKFSEQREIIYAARHGVIILLSRFMTKATRIHEAHGLVMTADKNYDFSIKSSSVKDVEDSAIRKYVSDWAYAFIEANRAPAPPPAAVDAPPAQPLESE